MKFFLITVFTLLTVPYIAAAQSQSSLENLSHSVRMLCNDDLGFTTVVSADGKIGAGGRLKIIGVGVGAEIEASQFNNLHNLYDNTRYNPVECRAKMTAALSQVFFRKTNGATSFAGQGSASGNYSGPEGSFSSNAGEGNATGTTSTDKGVATCYSGTQNPGPCVAQFK